MGKLSGEVRRYGRCGDLWRRPEEPFVFNLYTCPYRQPSPRGATKRFCKGCHPSFPQSVGIALPLVLFPQDWQIGMIVSKTCLYRQLESIAIIR